MAFDKAIGKTKLSTLLMSIMVLLSALSFSGSVSAHANTRTPSDLESVSKSNLSTKRKISWQEARQCVSFADFLIKGTRLNLKASTHQATRVSKLAERECRKQKPDPVKILPCMRVHLARNGTGLSDSLPG